MNIIRCIIQKLSGVSLQCNIYVFAVKHDAIPFKSYENIKSTQLILHHNVLTVTDHYSHYAYSM